MSATTNLVLSLLATGLSQIEVARLTKIPQPRLSRWQHGEVPCSADDALKLQALLVEVQKRKPKDKPPARPFRTAAKRNAATKSDAEESGASISEPAA